MYDINKVRADFPILSRTVYDGRDNLHTRHDGEHQSGGVVVLRGFHG